MTHLKLVLTTAIADPLFYNGRHAAWGADCPHCQSYVYESLDTVREEERKIHCDFCDKDFELKYPDEGVA